MTDDAADEEGARQNRRKKAGYAVEVATTRLPPHSPEAERGLLGCILIDAKLTAPIVAEAFPDTDGVCYGPQHSLLLRLMLVMFDNGEPVDMFSVLERLRTQNRLDEAGGQAYISELPDATPSSHNVQYFIDIVREKMLLRHMVHACTNAVNLIYGDATGEVDPLLDLIEKQVLSVRQRHQIKSFVHIKECVKESMRRFQECHENQGKMLGISTGLPDLDAMTHGLRKCKSYILAGLPGSGKSALAMNIGEHVAMVEMLPVGIFSLEMPDEELTDRSLCTVARVNVRHITTGQIADAEFPKLIGAATKLSKAQLYIDDSSGITIGQLRAKARRMWQEFSIKLLVIDYLQLLTAHNGRGQRKENRQEEVADISRGIKELAKELNIPIITLCQIDRNVEKENRKPRLSDLRESAAIGQDADLVGLLHKVLKEDEEEDPYTVATDLIIAKHRGGPTGTVHMTFFKTITKFECAAKISSDDVPPQSVLDLQAENVINLPHAND